MQTIPAINQEFIRNMESQRPQKRFTRLLADQIRATDFQTTQLEKIATQQHRDQITLQRQQAHQHQEIVQLLVTTTTKLDAIYRLLAQALTTKHRL